MSNDNALRQISRLEGLADALVGSSMPQINSLFGQIEGTIEAIRSEFDRYGLDSSIPEIASMGYVEFDERSIHEATRILHRAAARWRALAMRI